MTSAIIVAALALSGPAFADTISFVKTDGFYGFEQGVTPPGATGSADILYFTATAYGYSDSFYFVNGSGIITDVLFSPGSVYVGGAYAGDNFEFDGNASGNPLIGTTCTGGPEYCIPVTGGLQDISSEFTYQDGGEGFFLGGFLDVGIGTNITTTPEPSSLILLASGLAAGTGMMRRRLMASRS